MPRNKDADAIAAQVGEFASKLIREQCPYMKDAVLQEITQSLEIKTRRGITAHHSHMAANGARITSFYSLSAELRNAIYDLALEIDDQNPKEIVVTQGTPGQRDPATRLPTLLHVSKQIRSEVAPIYFGRNIFVADLNLQDKMSMAWEKAILWSLSLGMHNAAMIKHFFVRFSRCKEDFFAKVLKEHREQPLITAQSVLELLHFNPQNYGVSPEVIKLQHRKGRKQGSGWLEIKWVADEGASNCIWKEGRLEDGWQYWVAT